MEEFFCRRWNESFSEGCGRVNLSGNGGWEIVWDLSSGNLQSISWTPFLSTIYHARTGLCIISEFVRQLIHSRLIFKSTTYTYMDLWLSRLHNWHRFVHLGTHRGIRPTEENNQHRSSSTKPVIFYVIRHVRRFDLKNGHDRWRGANWPQKYTFAKRIRHFVKSVIEIEHPAFMTAWLHKYNIQSNVITFNLMLTPNSNKKINIKKRSSFHLDTHKEKEVSELLLETRWIYHFVCL
jgi:hypothetical protein